MEYTTLWQPLILIVTCLIIGLTIGALYMYRKYKMDISLLEADVEIAHDRLKELLGQYNVVRSKKDKTVPTKLDDSFKAQLQIKDDNIDRLNALQAQKEQTIKSLDDSMTAAAAQILVLEDRIAKNKKIAIKREEDLNAALTKIGTQLDTIDELESDTKSGGVQLRSSSEEIDRLVTQSRLKDDAIERYSKRITELESELEDVKPKEGETGYYKRMKKIE
jgi:chromosome segregation ATPase